MAISHADHDHPNTPAARAACRKALADGNEVLHTDGRYKGTPARMVVVPRKRGDGGVVKGMKAADPKLAPRRMKVSGTLIKAERDLADVPRVFAHVIREAWTRDWDVQVGQRFNEVERRIVISGEVGTVQLVWDASGAKIRTGAFVRSFDSSITRKVHDGIEGMQLVASADVWPWRNDEGMCI